MTQQEAVSKSLEIEREIETIRPYLAVNIFTNSGKKKKQKVINKEIEKRINELQAEADRLWNYAKSFNSKRSIKNNYEDLANAIIKQAIFDFEALISGTKMPTTGCNYQEIIEFAKDTSLTKIDIYSLLMKIADVRKKKYIPYARKNLDGIVSEYRIFKKKRIDSVSYNLDFPYRCYLCGNALKPDFLDQKEEHVKGVGCTTCKTYVYLKDI